MEELSANAEEISSHLDRIVNKAESAKSCSTEAARQLMIGTRQMEELSEAMGVISGSSNQISGTWPPRARKPPKIQLCSLKIR